MSDYTEQVAEMKAEARAKRKADCRPASSGNSDLLSLAEHFEPGGAEGVLSTYLKLHDGKLGMHWLWAAIERIAAGEIEVDVLDDYGYRYEPPR